MKLKPAGMALGLAGNLALGWGLYHLLGIGSCGGEYPACPSEATPYFIALPLGIIASVIAAFVGGGFFAFTGVFASVGIASLLRGINGGVGPEEVTGTIASVPVEQTWVTELARLNDLRMAGALTDEEFVRAKEKLLA
jgi:hypothetical protein